MPALAGTITSPSSPFSWPGDSNGNPTTTTDISVTGFQAHQLVYLEMCDGKPSTASGWDPTIDCDAAAGPNAALQMDANGAGTFSHTDHNHAFTPIKGTQPSGNFDCLSPNDPAPGDGLPQWRNCQLRASTNPNQATPGTDSFITILLPDAAASTPEVPLAIVLPISALIIGGGFFLLKKRQDARAAVRA
jgi:hypothetical protein